MLPLTYLGYIHHSKSAVTSTGSYVLANTSPLYSAQQNILHTVNTSFDLCIILFGYLFFIAIFIFVYRVVMATGTGMFNPPYKSNKKKDDGDENKGNKKETKNILYE
jgi:hypothetical protein